MTNAYPIWDTNAASALATLAHHGQPDKVGEQYRYHPAVVATKARALAFAWGMDDDEIEVVTQVAWLHDVIEDTKFTAGMLQDLGVPMDVLGPVMVLSRPTWMGRLSAAAKAEVEAKYYQRITQDRIALLVKQADLWHNLRPERLAKLDETVRVRLRHKYLVACKALGLDFDKVAA